MGALGHRQTQCQRGHPFVGTNVYVPRPGLRLCRACGVERQRAYRRRQGARRAHPGGR